MFIDVELTQKWARGAGSLLGYGRFMETDPIGYGDGLNWYNYVESDPINATDPTGTEEGDIVITAKRFGYCDINPFSQVCSGGGGPTYGSTSPFGAGGGRGGDGDIVIVAKRPKPKPGTQGPRTMCFGIATVTAVGPGQATGDGALYTATPTASRPSIRGGTFGTVAVQRGFLGLSKQQLALFGTQIFITLTTDYLAAQLGGPGGTLTVSDYGDQNVQNTSGVRFDLYRFSSMDNALKFGRRNAEAFISFPAISGGTCPAGFAGSPAG